MTDPGRDRHLAEEMRLLSDALAGLRVGDHDAGPGPRPDDRGRAHRAAPGSAAPDPPEEVGQSRGCPSCGCGAPGVCVACPLCRAAGLVAALRPDALSRLADLAALAADLLRTAAEGAARTPDPGEPARPSVEEIPVVRHGDVDPGDNLEEESTS